MYVLDLLCVMDIDWATLNLKTPEKNILLFEHRPSYKYQTWPWHLGYSWDQNLNLSDFPRGEEEIKIQLCL